MTDVITPVWFLEDDNWRYTSVDQMEQLDKYCKDRINDLHIQKDKWFTQPRKKLINRYRKEIKKILDEPVMMDKDFEEMYEYENMIENLASTNFSIFDKELELCIKVIERIQKIKQIFKNKFT
jgi:hypothetical protein